MHIIAHLFVSLSSRLSRLYSCRSACVDAEGMTPDAKHCKIIMLLAKCTWTTWVDRWHQPTNSRLQEPWPPGESLGAKAFTSAQDVQSKSQVSPFWSLEFCTFGTTDATDTLTILYVYSRHARIIYTVHILLNLFIIDLLNIVMLEFLQTIGSFGCSAPRRLFIIGTMRYCAYS